MVETTSELVLAGCAPVPLAGYLKAIAALRLIAEQADPGIRGAWRGDRFVLQTTMSESDLARFFVESYRPTPVVAPWNSGSGFWPKDNREGIDALAASQQPRLAEYRAAIETSRDLVRQTGGTEAPKEQRKAEMVLALRGRLAEQACQWLDGALALTADGLRYPPMLGTGGNDGRLDFSNNFMQRVFAVTAMDPERSTALLKASLFASPCFGLEQGAVGQFSPGSAGGINSTTGFDSEARVNPWDFVLTIEGAISFAAAAARRHAHDRSAALSFPFTTRMVGAGSGVTALGDEADARHELWAPLWSRPCGYAELKLLLSEGRAVLNGGSVRDGLDFARAASQLGVSRGVGSFARHAFLMRAGKAYFATPLARMQVHENGNPAAALISELDEQYWLSRTRNALHDRKAPASLLALGRRLDDALFQLTSVGSPEAVQRVLATLGDIVLHAGRQSKLQSMLAPPPRLSSDWATRADDESDAFYLALALASIDAVADDGTRFPFRCHLVPLETTGAHDRWSDKTYAKARAIWTGRDLVRDMAAVLERRLTEAQQIGFINVRKAAELPIRGYRPAPLAAIARFLSGASAEDARISALAAGLAWARSTPSDAARAPREDPIPFAYAAIKPLVAPDGLGPDASSRRIVDPKVVVRLLASGHVERAVTGAQRLARGAGLPSIFTSSQPGGFHSPLRLAAALLFPISSPDRDRLVDRAYPNVKKSQEAIDAA